MFAFLPINTHVRIRQVPGLWFHNFRTASSPKEKMSCKPRSKTPYERINLTVSSLPEGKKKDGSLTEGLVLGYC
jgi:hypothetical protein